MTPECTRFLELLRQDGDRAELVENLRCAASILDETCWRVPPATQTAVAYTIAARLRAVAAMLCDHARLHPQAEGAICRYCERVFAAGQTEGETP